MHRVAHRSIAALGLTVLLFAACGEQPASRHRTTAPLEAGPIDATSPDAAPGSDMPSGAKDASRQDGAIADAGAQQDLPAGSDAGPDSATGDAGASSSSVTVGSTTFALVESGYATGHFIDGPAYIVVPSGSVTLLEPTPAKGKDSAGFDHSGAMLNPQIVATGSFPKQSWDERLAGGTGDARYSAALEPSWPITVSAGDVVVKTVARPLSSYGAAVRAGLFAEVNVLYLLDAAPDPEAFAPSCWGWPGRGMPKPVSLTGSIGNIVSTIPSYPLAGVDAPTAAEMLDFFDHFDPFYGRAIGTSWRNFGSYENGSVAKGYSNYGRELGALVGAAGLMMISDGATAAQKRRLLVRFISQGIQWGQARIAIKDAFGGNGGHHQFHHIPVGLALKHTSIGTLSDLNAIMPGNCLAQSFFPTASQLASDFVVHSDGTKPKTFHRHTIKSVSGLSIALDTPRGAFQCRGLVLTRESDGASATVLSKGNQTALTIDAQPPAAFAAGDVVYLDAPWLRADRADWDIRASQGIANINQFNPSRDASYRSLQDYSDETMVLMAMGAWHGTFDKMRALVVLSKTPGYPTAANKWPEHAEPFKGHTFSEDFWTQHWAAISANQ